MPKLTLTFNLPDEEEAFRNAQWGSRYASALWQFEQELRKIHKYEELTEEQSKMMDRIRELFYNLVEGLPYE